MLLGGRVFGFVARESHYFSWSCLPRSCEYCSMPNRHHGPPKRRLPMTWHAHNNHTPPLHAQPPPRPAQTPIDYDLARTQQPHATPARPSVAPPPRFGRANGEFYYHRHPATACRRRVAPLWSQFPPHTHPQPPTLRPSNNAAPRTPRATPIHNLATAAFADATRHHPRQRGILLP